LEAASTGDGVAWDGRYFGGLYHVTWYYGKKNFCGGGFS
jgi:hypothetical protein